MDCKKRAYATMARATSELRKTQKMNWHRGKNAPMHVYMCDTCLDWHVGHVHEDAILRRQLAIRRR